MTASAAEDLAVAGPGALAAAVRGGEISPVELVELFLTRIERIDPQLNAFRATQPEVALAAAQRLAASEEARRGPLAGVPFAVKDTMALAGQRTTHGSRSPAPVSDADAVAVARLREAGAIPIGITNVPELAIFPWTATAAHGITRNPWDLTRSPGGSSGGSAAAVAAGLAGFATASDGAGSIRIPAACCGLVGMKPTRGRVSTLPAIDPWLGMSVNGALARTVADAALLLEVMQGGPGTTLPAEAFSAAAAAGADSGGPVNAPLRIAVSERLPPGLVTQVSADQRLALERTRRLLDELGHRVSDDSPEYGLAAVDILRTYLRGIADDYAALGDPSRAEPSTRQMAWAGRRLTPESRRSALLARRPVITARLIELFGRCDVLVTPGLSRTALPAEGGYGRTAPAAVALASRLTPWTAMANLTGQPAITIPAGFGSDGLPLSVQLVGAPGTEARLFALAAQLEAQRPWAANRPAIAVG